MRVVETNACDNSELAAETGCPWPGHIQQTFAEVKNVLEVSGIRVWPGHLGSHKPLRHTGLAQNEQVPFLQLTL